MNRYLAGAIGGLLATIPMTLVMESLYRRLPREERYPLPPREITQNILRITGQDNHLGEGQRADLSLLSHFVYGAATGALYPLVFKEVKYPVLYGTGYGLAIWGASYLGWIPALRILEPATRQPARRRQLMLCAHAVWGTGTVLLGERLAQRCDEAWHGEEAMPSDGWHRP